MRLGRTFSCLALGAMLLLSSCSTMRHVPEGKDLLSSVELEAEGEYSHDINKSFLRNYIRQKPNSRWFSLFKLPLATYSLSGRDSSKWINRMLRSTGEPPVLYSERLADLTCNDLQQELQNEGFLNAKVSKSVERKGKKKVDLTYKMKLGEPYFIHDIHYEIADSLIDKIIVADSANRLIHEGMKFNVSVLDNERKRITALLTDKGYYRFHKEFISYAADTAQDSRLIDLTLFLDLYKNENKVDTLHTKYYIRNIRYASGDPNDSRIHLRKHVQSECTYLTEKQPYSSRALQNTYARFGRLQAVKYTNINFQPIDRKSVV